MDDEPIAIQFDQEQMTFGDMVDFEDIAGISITNLPQGTPPNSRMLLAMVYIAMRRKDRSITLDTVKGMSISQVSFGDPTEAEPTPLKPLEQPAKRGVIKPAKAS